MTALAVNVFSTVLADRVIADEFQRPLRNEARDDRPGEPLRQCVARPTSMGKHAMK
jgi:hypothetical protein